MVGFVTMVLGTLIACVAVTVRSPDDGKVLTIMAASAGLAFMGFVKFVFGV